MDSCTRAATKTYKKAPNVFHCDQCAGQTPIESHPIDPTQTTVFTQGYLEQAGVQFVAQNIGFCSSHEVEHLAATNHETFDAKWLRNHKTDGAVEPRPGKPGNWSDTLSRLDRFRHAKDRTVSEGSAKHWFARSRHCSTHAPKRKSSSSAARRSRRKRILETMGDKQRTNQPKGKIRGVLLARRRNSSYIPENDPKMMPLVRSDRMSWMMFPHLLKTLFTAQSKHKSKPRTKPRTKSRTKKSRTRSRGPRASRGPKDQEAEDQEARRGHSAASRARS